MTATTLQRGMKLSGASESNKPTFTAPAYDVMAPRWKLCRDAMLGTEAMRDPANLDEYSPKGLAETSSERLARVKRAEFFPMFKETVKGLTGLVFRNDPELGDDVPQALVDLCENIDGAGTAMPVFARRVFNDGLIVGHSGILVDVPKVSSTKPLTLRQEQAIGLRPYWVHIKAEQVVNWRTQTINGNTILTLLVLAETIDAPDGDYGTAETTRYRVFRRDPVSGVILYEVWTLKGSDPDPELDDFGELRNAFVIPFTVFYAGERLAPLQSLPPLLDLAYTNIAHFQVLSDHRSSLHAAGNPILVIKGRVGGQNIAADPNAPLQNSPSRFAVGGVEDADGTPADLLNPDGTGAIPLGVNMGIEVDKDGDVTYAEHAGTALGASANELSAIETRGAAQGLAMLQRSTRAAQTAETEKLQRSEKDASLSSAARSLEDMLEMALAFTALFIELPSGGTISVDRKFEDIVVDTPRISALSQAQAAGQFTLETFWKMIGTELPDDFDPVEERARLEQAAAITIDRTTTTTASGDVGGGNPTGNDGGAPA